MGQLWSYNKTPRRTMILYNPNETTTNQNTSNQNESQSKSNIDSKIIYDNISNEVSCLETEFDKIYSHLNYIHHSEPVPCKKASELIINCLKKNPMRIGNCICEIEEYKKCVHEACMLKFKTS